MTDDASWLRSLLESKRPYPGPVVGRWALGIGDMVADHPLTPDKLRGLARKLNHFCGVAISGDGVEFDGDDVKWSDITEIRTRSLVGYLFSGGVDKQVDKLPLPWFPFRGKVIGADLDAVRLCGRLEALTYRRVGQHHRGEHARRQFARAEQAAVVHLGGDPDLECAVELLLGRGEKQCQRGP